MPKIDPNHTPLYARLSYAEKEKLYLQAASLISDNKRQLFDRLAPLRTRHLAVALEDVYQSHNAAAVLRSCDCFGVQDVHVVEANNPFNPAGDVAVGSSKWVDYYSYPDTPSAYARLRSLGYRIVATTPHNDDTLINDLDISSPTVLVFGTELTGLSQQAIDLADAYVKIPMFGFTESFNISVCAALSLFALTSRLRASSDIRWQLSAEETLDLKLHWCTQAIRDGEQVLTQLAKNI